MIRDHYHLLFHSPGAQGYQSIKRMIAIRNNKDYMTVHQTKAKPLKLSNKKPMQKNKSFPMHQKSLQLGR